MLPPRRWPAACAEVRHERAERRKERGRLGVRARLAAELSDRQDEVVRVLVDEAIATSNTKVLLAVIDQAFGRPQERIEVQGDRLDLSELSLDELRSMRDKVLEQHPELLAPGRPRLVSS